LFRFRYFLDIFERNTYYFPFYHSELSLTRFVSFRYRNKLKIRPKKKIGFMHVDITSPDFTFVVLGSQYHDNLQFSQQHTSTAWNACLTRYYQSYQTQSQV
jgi:hypothetical protein